jgi:hypothetical protein
MLETTLRSYRTKYPIGMTVPFAIIKARRRPAKANRAGI